MATNLETLELTISSNSEQASQGIGSLIRSLSALANAVGKSVGGLMKLNAELRELKSYGRMKLPNLAGKSGTSAAMSGVNKQMSRGSVLPEFKQYAKNGKFSSWMYGPRPLPTITNNTGASGMLSEEQNRRLNPQWYVQPGSEQWKQNILARNEALRKVETATQNATAVTQQNTQAVQQNAKAAEQAAGNTENLGKQASQVAKEERNLGNEAEDSGEKTKTFGDKVSETFSKIGRMASTMVTRLAIKALIKNFKSAWDSAYNFSKKMGGDFAANVDKVRGALGNMAVNIVRAFAPLMNVIAPVFTVMAEGVRYLADALSWLVGLLGITSDLLGSSAEAIGAAGTASKKTSKNVLASWDELNVIQQDKGGGGSGGSGSNFTSKFKEEIDSIKILVGEALLAVGLILAFSGHVGVGIALAAVGAAAIVGTIATKWGTMSDKVKAEILKIMTIAGASMLAVGMIIGLACPAKLGLGIALMVAGAANLVTSIALSWNTSDTVKKEVGKIMAIAGAALLAIGLIITLATAGTNPLGIGMMIAGGVSLAGAVALNWDGIVTKVREVMTKVANWFTEKWEVVKNAANNAWNSVKKWWEDSGLGQKVRDAWETVSGFFAGLWGSAEDGTGIAGAASKAWNAVSKWWEDSGIGETVRTAWSDVSSFFGNLFGDENTEGSIANFAVSAWGTVTELWEDPNVGGRVREVWNGVSDFFTTLFADAETPGSISYMAYDAWDSVSTWWQTNVTEEVKREGVWGGVKGFFKGIWGDASQGTGIAGMASQAWDSISKWWTTDASTLIGDVWNGVSTFFTDLIGTSETGLIGNFNALWAEASQLWGDIIGYVSQAWSDVGTWFYNNVTVPVGNFFIDMINGIISGINWVINALNSLHFTIPGWDFLGMHADPITIGISGISEIGYLNRITPIAQNANGAYGIPSGELFIANEHGAELVGSMNGKTTVANQVQIIEGIQKGVSDANARQNALLAEQNDLLRKILVKSGTVEINPSARWGKFNSDSNDMYSMATGR